MSYRLSLPLLALLAALFLGGGIAFADPKGPWVQTTEEADLWSGPDADAVSFGTVPQWEYFRVVQFGNPRHQVWSPRTKNYAFVDAAKVGPSGAPPRDYLQPKPTPTPTIEPTAVATPEPTPAPPPPPPFEPWWVQAFEATQLWSSAAANAFSTGTVTAWSFFQVIAPQSGGRLEVVDPLTGGTTFVNADLVGPAGEPSAEDLAPRTWRGLVSADAANVRSEPTTKSATVGELQRGAPVAVEAWVEGEAVFPDQPGWARLADGAYVYGPLLNRADLPTPPALPQGGAPFDSRWIDVNLTLQQITAYEGDVAVYTAPTSSGRPGWETPVGVFSIGRRVEKETMESSTLLGQDAERADYKVENVRWTQYFTNEGHALHENYWRQPDLFGIPSSHGCLGLLPADAQFFWDWAYVGAPVVIHH